MNTITSLSAEIDSKNYQFALLFEVQKVVDIALKQMSVKAIRNKKA